MSIKNFFEKIFFTSQTSYGVALFRIAVALLLLFSAFLNSFHLLDYYGESALVLFATSKTLAGAGRLNLFLILPQTNTTVFMVLGIHVLACVFLCLGLFTRFSALLVYITLTSFHHRNTAILHSGDTLLRLYSLYLIFSQAGKAFSLDRLISIARGASLVPSMHWPWMQRCMQFQLAWVYLSTAISKSAGFMWVNGTALYYVTRLEDFERFRIRWIVENMFFMRLLTWGTLVVEYSFPLLVWFREFRYWILVVGLCFHGGVELIMNIPIFQEVMLCGYILFIPEEDWIRLGSWIKNYVKKIGSSKSNKVALYFDGGCGFCRRAINVFRAMDVLDSVQIADFRSLNNHSAPRGLDLQRCEVEMMAQDCKGNWHGGFYAARAMFCHLPLMYLVNWIFYIPGINLIGVKLYKWVATNRSLLTGRD